MVTSTWASNLIWTLLGVNWLLEGRWSEKWAMAKSSRLLHVFLLLILLHVLGMIWTDNVSEGLNILRECIPLFVVPLVMLTTPPLRGNARKSVLLLYAATVVVVSIIGAIRLLTIPDLPYRQAIPYISHIRFSLNCCMVIYLAVSAIRNGLFDDKPSRGVLTAERIALFVVLIWMLVFLLLIRSFTAYFILLITSLVWVLFYRRKWYDPIVWLVIVGAIGTAVAYEATNYYRKAQIATQPLRVRTPNGHLYSHAHDGLLENGNYINNYICQEELEEAWPKRSQIPLWSPTSAGPDIQPTLVRYLNALHLPKDSLGVARLTDVQVAEIEKGIANPVYLSHNPIRKMVYVMLFEYECARHTSAVRDFTMLQRFEYWRATIEAWQQSPWIGCGTGDVTDQLSQVLLTHHSELVGRKPSPHNQYLMWLLSFGVVGGGLLLVFSLRALPSLCKQGPLQMMWLITILISCLTESTFCTLAGILFCTYFLAFRRQT